MFTTLTELDSTTKEGTPESEASSTPFRMAKAFASTIKNLAPTLKASAATTESPESRITKPRPTIAALGSRAGSVLTLKQPQRINSKELEPLPDGNKKDRISTN
ncbi:hypothetical protein ACOSP7_014299 [Xanthoceras sorbifolium]